MAQEETWACVSNNIHIHDDHVVGALRCSTHEGPRHHRAWKLPGACKDMVLPWGSIVYGKESSEVQLSRPFQGDILNLLSPFGRLHV